VILAAKCPSLGAGSSKIVQIAESTLLRIWASAAEVTPDPKSIEDTEREFELF